MTKSCPSRRSCSKHAVKPANPQATQPDLSHRGPSRDAARQAAATRTASALARTAWTRTAQAPCSAASAVVATVAASRRSTGRGWPAGSASRLAEEGLAARADQQRAPELAQLVERGQQRPVVRRRSWRSRCPDRGSARRWRMPAACGGVQPAVCSSAQTSVTTSVYRRARLHVGARARARASARTAPGAARPARTSPGRCPRSRR